jgi:hypothetical protein
LLVLAYVALPARWLSGLGVDAVFLGCLLLAPAVRDGRAVLGVLARAPVNGRRFEFRSGEAPRMDERWAAHAAVPSRGARPA